MVHSWTKGHGVIIVSSLLGQNIFLSILFSNTVSISSSKPTQSYSFAHTNFHNFLQQSTRQKVLKLMAKSILLLLYLCDNPAWVLAFSMVS
jgi:Ca2+/Na+ antiporter